VLEDRRGTWTGRLLRLAARRFLKDLNRALLKRPPFVFSPDKANAHCRFIENLPHVEGEWDTENIVLQPAQIFVLVQIFGFRKHNGARRYSQVVLAMARKNAKTTLAAGILLSCFCLERENGAQVISAATTGSQARIVWEIAKKMIAKRPTLRAVFDVEAFANSIARYETQSVFKPINSKASTQDGLNPSVVNLDEVHAHKTHDLLNVLQSAAGARKNPLWLYTTTEGYESPGPWPELREFSKRVLEGVVVADHFLAVLWMLDDEDDELDERNWPKANPLIYVNPYILEKMRELAISAKSMPGTLAEFRIKRCNLPAAAARAWVNLRKWNRCGGAVDVDFLIRVGAPCWGALDLASTADLAALRWLWLWEEQWYTWGRFWVPEEAVKQRTESNRVPYGSWVEQGLIVQTPGDVTDYDVIEAAIVTDAARFSPHKIGYDPWNASDLVNRLTAQGLPMEQFIQGFKSYNPAMKGCARAYSAGKLSHGGDPVLRWNISNVVPRYDANMNEAPDRKRSAEKIDGATTLFMAYGLALAEQDEGDSDGFFSAPIRSGGDGQRPRVS
jgi:phage terminase large subunit-like protein